MKVYNLKQTLKYNTYYGEKNQNNYWVYYPYCYSDEVAARYIRSDQDHIVV